MKKKQHNGRLVLLAVAVVGFVFLVMQLFGNYDYPNMTPMTEGWTINNEETTLPISNERIEGKSYFISNTLPEFYTSNMAICFKSENIYWQVFVDGKLVDSYKAEDEGIGSTPGDHWNFVLLPQSASGKKIDIIMQVVYAPGSNYIQRVYFGEYNLMYTSVIRSFIPGFMVCQLILVLSIVYIIINEAFIRKVRGDRILTYLGLFSVCASLWSASQSPILSLVFGNNYLIKCTTYLMLPFMLGFVIHFYVVYRKLKVDHTLRWIIKLPFVYGVLVILMDLTGLWPFPQSVMVTQAFLLGMIAMVVVNTIKQCLQYNKMQHGERVLFFGNFFMSLMGAVDVYRCYALGVDDYSKNTRLAFMVYTIILGIDQILDFMEYQHMLEESKIMKKIAFIDGLTGVGNRMAFNKALDTLPENELVGFVHFDINNLKRANDDYGHIEGDKLIQYAANAIEDSFANIGKCYRYGGDEFTVILEHFNVEAIERDIEKLQHQIEAINDKKQLHVPLGIAYGYAHFEKGTDFNMTQVFNRADEQMYCRKKKMKMA